MPELAPWTAPGKTWAPEVLRREDGKYVRKPGVYELVNTRATLISCSTRRFA